MPRNSRQSFQKASRPGIEEGALVNYVWLNDKPDASEQMKCSLPLTCLDNVYRNATFYPKAQFQIWIDPTHFNASSKFFIDSHAHIFAPPNVVMRDIREIPEYSQSNPEFFGANPSQDIWNRVDLARLLVIEECFKTSNANAVFYTDFDIRNVRLHSPKMAKCLKQFGAIFAGTSNAYCENSFMGFERDVAEHILPRMINEGTEESLLGNCVFDVFCRVVDNYAECFGVDLHNRDMSLRIGPDHLTPMKMNPIYRELEIN